MKEVFKTQEDKVNYLKGLIRVAKCNGIVEPEEMEYFSLAAKKLKLDQESSSYIESLWHTKEKTDICFSSRYLAVFFMQEAFQLCIVDGTFDAEEKLEIAQIGDELGISKEDRERIHSWIMEGMEWRRRGEELVDEIAGEV